MYLDFCLDRICIIPMQHFNPVPLYWEHWQSHWCLILNSSAFWTSLLRLYSVLIMISTILMPIIDCCCSNLERLFTGLPHSNIVPLLGHFHRFCSSSSLNSCLNNHLNRCADLIHYRYHDGYYSQMVYSSTHPWCYYIVSIVLQWANPGSSPSS